MSYFYNRDNLPTLCQLVCHSTCQLSYRSVSDSQDRQRLEEKANRQFTIELEAWKIDNTYWKQSFWSDLAKAARSRGDLVTEDFYRSKLKKPKLEDFRLNLGLPPIC